MDKIGVGRGADDYVTKPFGLRELLSRLRALRSRAYGELAASADSNQLGFTIEQNNRQSKIVNSQGL